MRQANASIDGAVMGNAVILDSTRVHSYPQLVRAFTHPAEYFPAGSVEDAGDFPGLHPACPWSGARGVLARTCLPGQAGGALFQERIVDSAKLLWLVRRGRSKPKVGVSCRDGEAEPRVAQRG